MKCQRCGKENPAEVHTCTPLALRLAEKLDSGIGTIDTDRHKAAAELRRLYADLENAQRHFAETMQAYQDEIKANEALQKECRTLVRQNGEWKERDTALLRQALEALVFYGAAYGTSTLEDFIITTLRERLGEKA